MIKQVFAKILMILLPISILILAIFLVKDIKKKSPQMTFRPPEVLTPTPVKVRPASRWATDSAVLEIEENLKNIAGEIETVDLKESSLFPPILDMEVKF